jgi:hypothetical protein
MPCLGWGIECQLKTIHFVSESYFLYRISFEVKNKSGEIAYFQPTDSEALSENPFPTGYNGVKKTIYI